MIELKSFKGIDLDLQQKNHAAPQTSSTQFGLPITKNKGKRKFLSLL
jgi:hypothetical protein